ncbi:GNAT family N-acetyltransferase [Paenibacillus sp. JX-17]|uniref:GNAT family N-acetyltransferase n=1 Tax=Paenibacillus lacisoli TaxID=3064525 RepID=A0ABT9CD72_9BACL|nr:GNAT family N-acetyltransferase [Paenibacillus sp. JX-17]MDO7905922.1 GNAT family N-acetyltransferase [Paenibacillus sp. JX-17]
MHPIIIRNVSVHDKELHSLISQLDEELLQRYPTETIYRVDFTDPKVSSMVFAVAFDQELPVGCGGIRRLEDGDVELKRFFVIPSHRRMGVAEGMLKHLEDEARQWECPLIKLETGAQQPDAIAFYSKHGFRAVERFGEYSEDENSLCYAKPL